MRAKTRWIGGGVGEGGRGGRGEGGRRKHLGNNTLSFYFSVFVRPCIASIFVGSRLVSFELLSNNLN